MAAVLPYYTSIPNVFQCPTNPMHGLSGYALQAIHSYLYISVTGLDPKNILMKKYTNGLTLYRNCDNNILFMMFSNCKQKV